MSIAPYIKEIGRGKEGARVARRRSRPHDLMSQVLDGQRHRPRDRRLRDRDAHQGRDGRRARRLPAGRARALHRRCAASGPTVVLPRYNGARKLPNLTALLALLLAQEGVPVLVHGPRHDPAA